MVIYIEICLAVFMLGVCGILLTSKHFIKILIALELILLSVNMLIILFSTLFGSLEGQIIFVLILTVGAAEASIGLSLMLVFFRLRALYH